MLDFGLARQEHRLGAADAPEMQRIGWLAERCGHSLFPQILEAGQVIDARAPDDPDDGFGDWNIPFDKYSDENWHGNW